MGTVSTQLRTSRTAMSEVFANRSLRRLFIALAGSVIGDWAYSLASSVYVYSKGGPTAVGVLGVVRFLSIAIVSPFASTLADKMDRKSVMIVSDLIRFVLIIGAALLIFGDAPALPVYVLAVASALVGTAFRPAERALKPSLARHPGELTAANVVSSTVESVAMFLGPAVAGLLLAIASVQVVYLFNAASFLWSAVVVFGIRAVIAEATPDLVPDGALVGAADSGEINAADAADGTDVGVHVDAVSSDVEAVEAEPELGFFANAATGFQVIFASRDLLVLVALYCAQTIVAGASLVFSVAIAFDLLGLGKSGLGVLEATVGVGGLVGGFVALILAQRGKLATDFGFGVIAWAAPLLLVAAVPRLGAGLIMMSIIGLANSVVDVNALTIMQRLVPDKTMGRVFGAMESALIGSMALGSLAMPFLIHTFDVRWALAIMGGFVTFLGLVGLPALRRIDSVALAPLGIETLRGIPIFAVLPNAVLERLTRGSSLIEIAAGQTVVAEGGVGDRFYIIEAGTVDVTIRGEHIRTLGAGGSFGEIALLRDIPRTATVTAETPLVLRTIERDSFVAAVTGFGEAAAEADQVISTLLQYR
jgi:MFS family permease